MMAKNLEDHNIRLALGQTIKAIKVMEKLNNSNRRNI